MSKRRSRWSCPRLRWHRRPRGPAAPAASEPRIKPPDRSPRRGEAGRFARCGGGADRPGRPARPRCRCCSSMTFPRRFVATVDNLGGAACAGATLAGGARSGKFGVERRDGLDAITAGNADRYAAFLTFVEKRRAAPRGQRVPDAVPGIPAGVRGARLPGPLLQRPAGRGHRPAARHARASLRLPRVHLPPINGPVRPERPWVLYEFDDPALDRLASGQKMLLRMGPAAERRLKARLRRVQAPHRQRTECRVDMSDADRSHPRLLADVGGTHARFGWVAAPGAGIECIRQYRCSDHASLESIVAFYLADQRRPAPRSAAIGIATPVDADRVTMTNLPWSFSIEAMRERFALDRLVVLNDFAALALATPLLGAEAFRRGRRRRGATRCADRGARARHRPRRGRAAARSARHLAAGGRRRRARHACARSMRSKRNCWRSCAATGRTCRPSACCRGRASSTCTARSATARARRSRRSRRPTS